MPISSADTFRNNFSQDTIKKDSIRQDTLQQEILQQDTSRQDTSRQDTSGEDTARQDTSGQDTARSEKQETILDSEVDYQAEDSIILSRVENKVYLYGDAKVVYGDIELTADYIEYSQDSNVVSASGVEDSTGNMVGLPVFKEGGKTYNAHNIRYNFKNEKGYIQQVKTEEEGGYLHSSVTKKHQNREFHFRDGKYTTCDHDNPHFYIRISKGKVIPGEKIIAGSSYMVLEDLPLYPLMVPFGYFPIQKKRSSGIYDPSFGEENRRGFYLKGGYYFGISDYMDLKVYGSVYTKGSWNANLDYQVKKRYKYTSKLSLKYDRLLMGEKGADDYRNNRGFEVRWSHRQSSKANPYSSFNASVNLSSTAYDKDFSQNMEDYTTNTKSSNISYQKTWPDSPFSFNGKLRHSQNSKTKMVNLTLPEMSFDMSRQYPLRKLNKSGRSKWYDDLQVSYNADLKNKINSPDSLLFENTQFSDFESGIKHSMPVSLNFKVLQYLNITPKAQYRGVLFPRYIEKHWDPDYLNPDDSTYGGVVTDTVEQMKYAHSLEPSVSVNMSPKFFGMYQFKGEKSKVEAIRHVITPSVGVNFRPDLGNMTSKYYDEVQVDSAGNTQEYSYFDDQLYSPPSTPEKSGSVNFGLSNNVEMKVRSKSDTAEKTKKIKLLNELSFNTSYNIFKDSLNWSPIRISGRTNMFDDNLRINFSGRYDPYALNENGKRINVSEWEKNQKPGRLTNFSLSLGTKLGPDGKNSSDGENGSDDEGREKEHYNPYDYFDIPWSLSLDYSLNYSKRQSESEVKQTVSLSGNFSLTDKWKINFDSHYDISEDKLSATSISIDRDLHCWSMSFRWVPVGYRKNYRFEISVNKAILKDLKYEKQKSWTDYL
ncbi:MAG: putative LPS assembly protein LptD [Bacteroidota bacterium]